MDDIERSPVYLAAEHSWRKATSTPELISFDDWLISKHKRGMSNERIAQELYYVTHRETAVSLQTVRAWLSDAIARRMQP